MEDFWSDKHLLTDLLFDTNMSLADIAKELEISPTTLSKRIKEMNLDWIRRKNRKMSRGQSSLTATLQKLLPNENIVNEYHVGEQLRLDVYCPSYKLAIEYHGRQHYDYVGRFFDTYEDFLQAQKRDERKLELCKEQGITVVVFKYNDDLSEDCVYERVLAEIRSDIGATPIHRPTKKNSVKNHPYYEEMKSRRREIAKQSRDRMKAERKAAAEKFIY